MISIIDLFDKDNILCPEWLSNEYLEDDWKDSTYSFEDGKHTWNLETPFKKVRITFDGEEYQFLYFNEIGELTPIEIITETESIQA